MLLPGGDGEGCGLQGGQKDLFLSGLFLPGVWWGCRNKSVLIVETAVSSFCLPFHVSLPELTDILEEHSYIQEMIVTLEFSFNGVALIFNLPPWWCYSESMLSHGGKMVPNGKFSISSIRKEKKSNSTPFSHLQALGGFCLLINNC